MVSNIRWYAENMSHFSICNFAELFPFVFLVGNSVHSITLSPFNVFSCNLVQNLNMVRKFEQEQNEQESQLHLNFNRSMPFDVLV